MKPDLLDNGMDSALAAQLLWLSAADITELSATAARIVRVIERAERLMPGIGFGDCAKEVQALGLSDRVLALQDKVRALEQERDDAKADYETCVDSAPHCIYCEDVNAI